ncbi:hypothetical protein ACQEVZ_44210 [Dactylosporangium sp. CA-152071]|uniref:hypothetical protein n=1 Tax=Dactylosporangium sp. CA-152071 TaxID=3239933 RepID=UPI003D9408AC
MDGVALPVTVRDSRLKVVATGSTGEPITLPPGTYAVSVPLPAGPDSFDEVVVVGPGSRDTRLAGPAQTVRDPTTAAIALAERGRPDAAVHVLRGDLANLPTLGLALLGFTALQLGDDATATDTAARIADSPDGLALRATLIQRRADADERLDELAFVAARALAAGVPRLRAAAFALVAALRDTASPPTDASRTLMRRVRHCDLSRVILRASQGLSVDVDQLIMTLPALRTNDLVLAAAPVERVHRFESDRGNVRVSVRQMPGGRVQVELTTSADRVRCFLIRFAGRDGGDRTIVAPVWPRPFTVSEAVVELTGFAGNRPWSVEELTEPFSELRTAPIRDSIAAAADVETIDAWRALATEVDPATRERIDAELDR